MDGRMLARLAAIVFVAIAITVSLIEMSRKDEPAPVLSAPTTVKISPTIKDRHPNGKRLEGHLWA